MKENKIVLKIGMIFAGELDGEEIVYTLTWPNNARPSVRVFIAELDHWLETDPDCKIEKK